MKKLIHYLIGRCSPFPYVVTLLYHTNIDNCVTKTRIFSEFSILSFVVTNNVFENLVNVTNSYYANGSYTTLGRYSL